MPARRTGRNWSLCQPTFQCVPQWQTVQDTGQVGFVFGQVKVEDHLPGGEGNIKTLMLRPVFVLSGCPYKNYFR